MIAGMAAARLIVNSMSSPDVTPTTPPVPDRRFGAPVDASRSLVFDPEGMTGEVVVDVVIPCYNEQAVLPASINRLHEYLTATFPFTWRITIADNASTDATWAVACQLAQDLPCVRALHLDVKGRGRALRVAWSGSEAAVVAYMDVDLSTDLDALLPLVAPLVSGHSDVAIGTRLASTAQVSRGPRREAVSRAYNLILRAALHADSGRRQSLCTGSRRKPVLPECRQRTGPLVARLQNGLQSRDSPVGFHRTSAGGRRKTDLPGWRPGKRRGGLQQKHGEGDLEGAKRERSGLCASQHH